MAWVGVGGGVPPELGKLPPPPGFEMLLFTGEIWREESMGCQTIYAGEAEINTCVERSDD